MFSEGVCTALYTLILRFKAQTYAVWWRKAARTTVAVFVSAGLMLPEVGPAGNRALMVVVVVLCAVGVTRIGWEEVVGVIRDCWLLSRDWRRAGRLFCGAGKSVTGLVDHNNVSR